MFHFFHERGHHGDRHRFDMHRHHHGDHEGSGDGGRGGRGHDGDGGRGGHGGRGPRGPKMFDAGAMRYVVLQLIADKPRHGYEIIKEIEQRAGGSYAPSPGVIYPMLSMLLDLGHVSATSEGNKKLHEITPDGLAFLEENREFVDVIMARLARMGSPADGAGDLRQLMHALKEVVITRARIEMADETRLNKIAAILRQAAADVAALD